MSGPRAHLDGSHGTTARHDCSFGPRRGAGVALGGDGQVTLGNVVLKGGARKVRRLYQDRILAGFAGGTANAFTLFERFEAKLDKHQGNLMRSAVELAKDWRTDRVLRRLEAMLAVAKERSLIITGMGDVLEPEHGILAIGSGGPYAQAAARALVGNSNLSPEEIVDKAMAIAGDICIYTNHEIDRGPGMSGEAPREIVHELSKYIVGQARAKRAVADALRNRWRRQQWRSRCAPRSRRRTS